MVNCFIKFVVNCFIKFVVNCFITFVIDLITFVGDTTPTLTLIQTLNPIPKAKTLTDSHNLTRDSLIHLTHKNDFSSSNGRDTNPLQIGSS